MRAYQRILLLLLLLLCLLHTGAALASEDGMARDITADCLLNGLSTMERVRDGSYSTHWQASAQRNELIVEAPAGELIGGLLLRWYGWPQDVLLQAPGADGEAWETLLSVTDDFCALYIPVDGRAVCRVVPASGSERLALVELTVVTPGTLPDDFQVWRAPKDKVDLMLIHGHPDDELIWFGGLLPTYAGERQKEVLTVCVVPHMRHRRLELLDALWMCGVRAHPVFARLPDVNSSKIADVFAQWGRDVPVELFTQLYRQYKPDVVVLHDTQGEYGHAVHRIASQLGVKAVGYAEDESRFPAQVEQYGLWSVPKVYIHLYPENQIQMDWWQPLDRFGGKTAQDVAREAYACHVSQKKNGKWDVWDGGQWDNSLFGLYRSLVGPDALGGDMFENID